MGVEYAWNGSNKKLEEDLRFWTWIIAEMLGLDILESIDSVSR